MSQLLLTGWADPYPPIPTVNASKSDTFVLENHLDPPSLVLLICPLNREQKLQMVLFLNSNGDPDHWLFAPTPTFDSHFLFPDKTRNFRIETTFGTFVYCKSSAVRCFSSPVDHAAQPLEEDSKDDAEWSIKSTSARSAHISWSQSQSPAW